MNATTTTRTTSGRTITYLAALALAFLAALLVSQAASAVGASTSTINKRIGQHQQDCGTLGGTFEYTFNYDKNGNLTTVVTTCSDSNGDVLITCDVSTRSSDCVPPTLTSAPSSLHDTTIISGDGEASTAGSGTTAPQAGTRVAPGSVQVVLATDDDEP